MLLQRSSLVDTIDAIDEGSRAGGEFEMHLGAMRLQLGMRPAPEWRAQLGMASEVDRSSERDDSDAQHKVSIASLKELAATLPPPSSAPSDDVSGVGNFEIGSLPSAAHCFIRVCDVQLPGVGWIDSGSATRP